MSTSNRWLVGIGAALGVLVVLALVAAVVTGGREPVTYPEDTPEGVVQRYLNALAERDTAAAYDYLSPELQSRCSLEDWRQQARWTKGQIEESQVLLEDVQRPAGGEAIVQVSITRFSEPGLIPVPPPERSFDQEFALRQAEEGIWAFSEMPWPVFGCPTPTSPFPPAPPRSD